MNNFIENNEDEFANGHVSCDLRGNSDDAKSETQLDPEEFPAPIDWIEWSEVKARIAAK